jgi:hypothetical protein
MLWLDQFPQGLLQLNISKNKILSDGLPEEFPDTIEVINADHNLLVQIEDVAYWGSNLSVLSLAHNPLIQLPDNLPDSIVELNISNTVIKTIHKLPQACTIFKYYSGVFKTVPEYWPLYLEELYVADNKLESLGDISYLPLRVLNCSKNMLKKMPELPQTLQSLRISWNYLTEIPALPDTLHTLYAQKNHIRQVEKLPANLLLCDIRNNCLTDSVPGRNVLLAGNWNEDFHNRYTKIIQKAWYIYKLKKALKVWAFTYRYKLERLTYLSPAKRRKLNFTD